MTQIELITAGVLFSITVYYKIIKNKAELKEMKDYGVFFTGVETFVGLCSVEEIVGRLIPTP